MVESVIILIYFKFKWWKCGGEEMVESIFALISSEKVYILNYDGFFFLNIV